MSRVLRSAAGGVAIVCAWAGIGLVVVSAVCGRFAYVDAD